MTPKNQITKMTHRVLFDCTTRKEPFINSHLLYNKIYCFLDGDSKRFLGNDQINKRFNVISLEFSKTKLTDFVKAPTVFSKLAWQRLWPKIDRYGFMIIFWNFFFNLSLSLRHKITNFLKATTFFSSLKTDFKNVYD